MGSALPFIQDVIYNLKRDYGVKIAIISNTIVTDLGTGVKTSTYDTVIIQKAILLPTSVTSAFMQQLTNGRVGTVEKDQRQILIDKKDLRGKNVTGATFIGYSGSAWKNEIIGNVDWENLDQYNSVNNTQYIRTDIKKLEDLPYAMTLTVLATNGLTIV